jgi:hypothetical protein
MAKTTTAAKKTTTTKAVSSKQAKAAPKSRQVIISDDDESEDEDDMMQEQRKRPAAEDEDEDIDMDSLESEDEPPPVAKKTATKRTTQPAETDEAPPIPPKLLTRLLYEGFEDKDVKIGKEAMLVVGKYVDTFVREALARAVFERNEQEDEGGNGTGDGFLQVCRYVISTLSEFGLLITIQVEDLEKLAPQLLLDF